MPICKLDCWADINTNWKSLTGDRRWRVDVGSELMEKVRSDGSWTRNSQVHAPVPGVPDHPIGFGSAIFEEKRPPRTELYWDGSGYRRDDTDERRYSIQRPGLNLRPRLHWLNFR